MKGQGNMKLKDIQGNMKLKDIKELYGAWVRFPKDEKEEIVFAYSAMEIKQHHDTMLEMKHPYFTSRNYSTDYFSEDMLEKEYRISDELKVFYSANKESCMEWLKKERDKTIGLYRRDLERLEKSEIKEKIERSWNRHETKPNGARNTGREEDEESGSLNRIGR